MLEREKIKWSRDPLDLCRSGSTFILSLTGGSGGGVRNYVRLRGMGPRLQCVEL